MEYEEPKVSLEELEKYLEDFEIDRSFYWEDQRYRVGESAGQVYWINEEGFLEYSYTIL